MSKCTFSDVEVRLYESQSFYSSFYPEMKYHEIA